MTGGPPVLEISAVDALGFAKQTAFGSPATVPANGNNWIEWRTRALRPVTGRKLYKTGAGVRGDSRKRGRAKSNTGGTFSCALQNQQGVPLIAFSFGCDDSSGASPANATTISAAAAGDALVVVASATGYAADGFIQIGPDASGRTEVHQILSVVSTTVNFKNSEVLARSYAAATPAHTVSSPYTHLFSNALPPPFFTLAVNRSQQWYQIQDCQIDKLALALTGDDEFVLTPTILGGNGFTEIAAPTPTFLTDINELNLADCTAATLLSSVAVSDLAMFTYNLTNGVRQGFTAGSYYPQKQAAGEFGLTGDIDVFFDTAAVEAMVQAMVAGTEVNGAFTVGNHVINVANMNMLEPDWTDTLAELGRLKATWEARAANASTWSLSSTTAWVPYV